ncbi:GntR family transcriptional regulator [Mangrovicoccus algicola]|uniref:GntR family transcriptional regulator n=1 Tax=Mangrovicoccus algicola TaxID=2771008 RepID=A0A8J7CV02_9RHOB|nr:GntR family transcriptional regulator [Mangrovicoccus algicola]MBE3638174.1 GntR family transcriptional regulator [Mangrovicoccus algicola]
MNKALGATHAPLTKVVKDALREQIVSGHYASGARLVEKRISEDLGVSRMPVREALRELAAEGLVTIEPRRGASVSLLSDGQKHELIEVRATLEALNAKLAARRQDPEQLAELRAVLELGDDMIAAGDMAAIHDRNDAFHEALARAGGNSVLQEIMQSLRDKTSMLFVAEDMEAVRESWKQHADILRAVIAGDGELAALLAARHVYAAGGLPPGS